MFKQAKSISILFLITVLFLACSLNIAAAQNFYNPMSAAEFAKEKGLSDWESILQKDYEGNSFMKCGDEFCNKQTQECWMCRESDQIIDAGTGYSGGASSKTVGRCYPKGTERRNVSGTNCWKVEHNVDTTAMDTKGNVTVNRGELTGTDGKNYILFLGEQPTIQYGNNGDENESFAGCEVLPVKLYNMQSCFFCPLAALIFGAANDVTTTSFSAFSKSFQVVMVVVFAVWLAVLTLQQVFPMTKQDAPKFLSAIIKQGFKVMVAFLLLSYSNDLFRYFIIPLLEGGLQMGTYIQSTPTPQPQNWAPTVINSSKQYFNLPVSSTIKSDGSKSSASLYTHIEIYLASLQMQLARMQAIGTTLFCVGGHEIITIKVEQMKEGMSMMLLGGILAVFGFLLTISFAFYFMDGLLQLAVIGAMLPFMIAGWPLKATAQYASTGFKMLLNTFFVLFFTGFVVSVCINLVNESLAYSQNQQSSQDGSGLRTAVNAGLSGIEEAINNQNVAKLKEASDIGGMGFMLLIFSCLLGFKFVAQVSPLASNLASGGFKGKGGLAGRIGTMGASTIKGLAQKASSPTGKALADQYHAAGGIVGIVSAPVAGLGQLAGKAIGGADQENKAWRDKSFRGKVGAAVKRVTGAPRAAAKKVHSVYRKPKG